MSQYEHKDTPGNSNSQPIDIGTEISNILKEYYNNLHWFKDKSNKFYIVSGRIIPSKNAKLPTKIMLPVKAAEKEVPTKQLSQLRKGIHKVTKNDTGNYTLLKELIDTINELYKALQEFGITRLRGLLEDEKNKNRELRKKKEDKKKFTKQLREKESEITEWKTKFHSAEIKTNKIKIHDDQLMHNYNKLKQEFDALKKEKSEKNTAAQTEQQSEKHKCEELEKKIAKLQQTHKAEQNRLREDIKAKEIANKQLSEKINRLQKQLNIFQSDEFDNDYAPDIVMEEEEVKSEMRPLSVDMASLPGLPAADNISKAKSMTALASLDEFGHKYSPKNLNKCEKIHLIDMVTSLYLSNQKLKQELRENILGVGSENTFLNIDEILNKYVTLRTQTHNNLHGNLCDVLMEKKYNDEIEEEVLEKESYNILFCILYLCNKQIKGEFERLYTGVAKMIKVYQQKNWRKLISNLLHSTLQTHYKSLVDPSLNEEKEDSVPMFNFSAISSVIYDELLTQFGNCKEILNSLRSSIVEYIKSCLETIVILNLNKPKLHFNNLNDFEVNGTKEQFDTDKHEKCNYDSDDYSDYEDNDVPKFKQAKYVQYYCFPGLSIENKTNERKKKRKNVKHVMICKTQVVC